MFGLIITRGKHNAIPALPIHLVFPYYSPFMVNHKWQWTRRYHFKNYVDQSRDVITWQDRWGCCQNDQKEFTMESCWDIWLVSPGIIGCVNLFLSFLILLHTWRDISTYPSDFGTGCVSIDLCSFIHSYSLMGMDLFLILEKRICLGPMFVPVMYLCKQ